MSGTSDSLLDDSFLEVLASTFDDDEPSDNDPDQEAYIEDVFAGSSDRVTTWKSLPPSVGRIEINGAENRLLQTMKSVVDPILSASSRIVQKSSDTMTPTDFASIYADRDWYLLLYDYVNSRIDNQENKTTPAEIFEMTRVWMLQCFYGTTAKNLFTDTSEWFSPVRRVKITYNRYSFILRKLGAELPEIAISTGINDVENDANADFVWGSFNEHNDIVTKLERHVGQIGRNFLFERLTDITIDDDKLRHNSKTFGDHGLQRSGFRGSRCGPVMNAAGTVQSGLIIAIRFGRKGDSTLSTVKSILNSLGYGEESHLKHRLDCTILIDRGYHISSVIRLLLKLRCQILGTHSEKAGKWPFCTTAKPKEWQTLVPTDGARTAIFAKRKINNVECLALCYRSGSKAVAMLHTTLPYATVWDLTTTGSTIELPVICYKNASAEMLYLRWLSSVTMFVACQGCSPWFEARVGHLTGTTAMQTLRTIKFLLLDDPNSPSVGILLQLLGLSLERKTREQIIRLTPRNMKTAYKTLGYEATASTTREEYIDKLCKQYPSPSLVYQKLVTSWCMAPIKSRTKGVVESFRQGKLAEKMIHSNVVPFVNNNTSGLIYILQAFNVGLVKNREDHISAVSPDAVCVLGCTTVGLSPNNESLLAASVRKLCEFLDTCDEVSVEKVVENSGGNTFNVTATMEYKHKSEASTQQEARRIRSEVLREQKVVVLNLILQEDAHCFRCAVPNVEYRCQLLHECVTCKTPVACYTVATTSIEFVLILIVPLPIIEAYRSFTHVVRSKYLYWLFKQHTNDFDKALTSMPTFKTNDVKWGYAKDEGTVRCRLNLMMGLYDLRKEIGRPLLPSDGLKPLMVSTWNIGKGPIDDMSQVLATALPLFGPINGICWIWLRCWMLMMFNAWRLNAMNAARETTMSEQCDTRTKLLAARKYYGTTFKEFMKILFDSLQMPELLRNSESEDALSPQRPKATTKRVSYNMWAADEEWVKFRNTRHSGHVPSHLTTLVQQKFLPGSASKRKRKDMAGNDNIDGEEGKVEDGVVPAATTGKRQDNRKWCFRCTFKRRIDNNGSVTLLNLSRINGSKPKKTSSYCMRCQVALCKDCFRPWHDEQRLLPTPPPA